jgi:hypothetical protein
MSRAYACTIPESYLRKARAGAFGEGGRSRGLADPAERGASDQGRGDGRARNWMPRHRPTASATVSLWFIVPDGRNRHLAAVLARLYDRRVPRSQSRCRGRERLDLLH